MGAHGALAPALLAVLTVLLLHLAVPVRTAPTILVQKKANQSTLLDGCRNAPVWTSCMRAFCDVSEIDMNYNRPSISQQIATAKRLIREGRSILTFGYKPQTVHVFSQVLAGIHDEPGFKGAILVCTGEAPEPKLGKVLPDPKVLSVWASHIDQAPHPKLKPIPLGFNFHSAMTKRSYEGHDSMHWIEQWEALSKAVSRPVTHNKLIYVCFRKTHNSRINARNVLDAMVEGVQVRHCSENTPRAEFWQQQRESLYVASPRGFGADAHRNWEAMYLEVPIIGQRTGVMDALFEDLPAYMVDKWEDLKYEEALAAHADLLARGFHRERLYSWYWQDLIEKERAELLKTV